MWPTRWLLPCILTSVTIPRFTTEAAEQHPLSPKLAPEKVYLNHKPLLTLHRSLIEIESISGNEHDVGVYLHDYLVKHNYTVERQYVGSDEEKPRFNLLAYPGQERQTRVLLSSHIDTVPPFWPYEIRNHDEIWGRGSVDDKACVVTQIMALEELRASGEIQAADVGLLFVVGEETGGDGMRKANELNLSWESVIFGEPTELKLVSGHKGLTGFTITAHGKAAHSGYPWLGRNANSMLIPALAALDSIHLPSSTKYGNSTVNIGMIEGGVAANVVAESASASVGVRIADGSAQKMRKILLDAIKAVDDRLEVNFPVPGYGPVSIDSDVEGWRSILFASVLSYCPNECRDDPASCTSCSNEIRCFFSPS